MEIENQPKRMKHLNTYNEEFNFKLLNPFRKKKFQSKEQLMKFVLGECGDMKYDYGEFVLSETLHIKSYPNFEYIIYADKLLHQEFNIHIDMLFMYGLGIDAIPKDFLEKLKVTTFVCSDNQLRELPNIPQGLFDLTCRNNHLRELPNLPTSLEHLNCEGNELEELPKLPKKLKKLDCSKNNLKEIPELPTLIEEINFDNNDIHIEDWIKYYREHNLKKFKKLYIDGREVIYI